MSYDDPTVTRHVLAVEFVNTTRSTGCTVSDDGESAGVDTIRIW